ncbi:MAG: hypothetical protein QOJ30_2744 [Pseudonocardiales bacterium]|jgi:uncharacterized protein YbjT (DUF2867 family)|nr:hypothetical protein [Pseudonocardiales bacterium]
MILVTGATGQVGYRLVEELTDAREPVTGMVRVEAKALDLPPAAGHVVATLDGPPSPDVLRTFDRIFLMSPSSEEQVELEIAFIDAVLAAGHRPHLVKLAADGFQDPDCTVRFMRNHRQVAAHIDAMDLPATYVAPNLYMENLLTATDTIREQGVVSAPAGDGRVAFMAAADVAAVAARALTLDGPDDIYVVGGPEALSYTDVAARISAVFARQVEYVDITPDEASSTMLAAGFSDWQAEGMVELFEWVRGGACAAVTDDARTLTGESPRPLERWLDDRRGAFLGLSPDTREARF